MAIITTDTVDTTELSKLDKEITAILEQEVALPSSDFLASSMQMDLQQVLEKLRQLIAQPEALLAELMESGENTCLFSPSDLFRKVSAFEQSAFQNLNDAWKRLKENDATTCSYSNESHQEDIVMKQVIFYATMWKYVCSFCVDLVIDVQMTAGSLRTEGMSLLGKRRSVSLSPLWTQTTRPSTSTPLTDTNYSKRVRVTRSSSEFMIGWFLAHKSYPYPTVSEREEIANKTGLTDQQVRNWFANMRKRHWRPSRGNIKKPRRLLDVVLRHQEEEV